MESHLQELIACFSGHSSFALAAVFAAAALEALALIGTVIPGSSVVFVGGVLVGLNVLDPWWTILASMAGAVLGDGLSYWLGHHYQERLLTVWPLRNYRPLFDLGRAYFAANGGKSVFFGRFLTPVRAIVPVIAGMSGMPPALFYWMNLASALAWSVAHILPGILFGASLQVAGAVSSRLVVVLLVFAALSWLVFSSLRLLLRHGSYYLGWLRERIVSAARRRRGVAANLLGALFDPAQPESGSLLTAALLLMAGGSLFLGIVQNVFSDDPLARFDSSVLALLQGIRTPSLDQMMMTITGLGGPLCTLALVGTSSLLFSLPALLENLGILVGRRRFRGSAGLGVEAHAGARPSAQYLHRGSAVFLPERACDIQRRHLRFPGFFANQREIASGEERGHGRRRGPHHANFVFPPVPWCSLVVGCSGESQPGIVLGGAFEHRSFVSREGGAGRSFAGCAAGAGDARSGDRL